MKALFTVLLLALSLTTFSAEIKVECLDKRGNVVDGSIEGLKKIINKITDGKTQVYVTGVITKIEKEDNKGLRHQKYNIQIDKDISFLIISNLSFGRVPIAAGKTVSVCGEYKKVGKGMVHWTHFDPHGPHADGFTIVDGIVYGDKEESLINNF